MISERYSIVKAAFHNWFFMAFQQIYEDEVGENCGKNRPVANVV